MDSRFTGLFLVLAAGLFWLAWLLMPGVGVTDAAEIFALVSSQRQAVLISVVVQLVSAALYVPAALGLTARATLTNNVSIQAASGLLLLGAMGSAADAVLHLLAYAMTAPNLEPGSLLRVMAFMQGPGLLLLAPLVLALFVGGAWLSIALADIGVVSQRSAYLHGWAIAFAVVGGLLASKGLLSARAVGVITLGIFSAAQVWAGAALMQQRRQVVRAAA